VPSAALTFWQSDRLVRLTELENHCIVVQYANPPAPSFLDESQRGFVLHLAAHFQGFCRDLYTESVQVCVPFVPAGMRPTLQTQFLASLALDRANATHESLKSDFRRFGFVLDLRTSHTKGPQLLADLERLNGWRNRIAHQGVQVRDLPAPLTIPLLQTWRQSADDLAIELDRIMHDELLRITGAAPW
jgi:hypothetical protein